MMRRNALAMGAAVFAAVPVVMSCPVSTSADYFPTWEQYKTLYDYNTTDPTIDFLYGDPVVGIWWKYYYSALYAIVEGVYINASYEITPGDFTGLSGFYMYNGARRFGALYASGAHTGITVEPSGGVTLCAVWSLQDGALECSLTPSDYTAIYNFTTSIDNNRWTLSWLRTNANNPRTSVFFHGTGICDDASFWNNTVYNFYNISVTTGDPPTWSGHSSDYISRSANSAPLLGQATTFPEPLPTSDVYPTITRDNALDYISDVLNPYISEQSPDLVPYLYNPHEGEPVFPTGDFVQGMPKEWTVENPALPSYNLDLQLPTADFEAVDVSTPLEHHATGLRFWWALLGECLDHFGVKELVIFALALGLIVTILTRLGR